MSFEIKGELTEKGEVQTIKNFQKQVFKLKFFEGMYENTIQLEAHQRNFGELEKCELGDEITVNFSIKGKEYKKEGKAMFFQSLVAWRISKQKTSTTESPNDILF